MAVFELVIGLLFVGAVLAAVARRIKAPYPALLALAGAVLALFENTPSVVLDPELVLALLVAPVLLDTAFDSSPRDLKDNWRPVTSLAIVAVGVTVVAVALVARWLVPGLPVAAAVALGAIVAPPDAAAASAVLRQLQPPRRVLVILEGESLFNDATALLIYRLAVAAVVTGSFSVASALPTLAVVTAGSVVLGIVLGRVVLLANRGISDVPTVVIVQFLSTFAVWILAEHLRLSGIITIVVFAISIARKASEVTPARLRLPSYAVWEVMVFVLNVLAFILIGMSLKPILARLSAAELESYLVTAAAVCAAVIVVRIVWVMGYAALGRLRRKATDGTPYPSFRLASVIAWCGMRGIVTLAAALALPAGFPRRDLVLFCAAAVVLLTLVAQGLTVGPLMGWLRIPRDDSIEREVRTAQAAVARAALASLRDVEDEPELVTMLRRKLEAQARRADAATNDAEPPPDDGVAEYAAAAREANAAQRRALQELRATGVIGDDAYHRVEEELDFAEVNAANLDRS